MLKLPAGYRGVISKLSRRFIPIKTISDLQKVAFDSVPVRCELSKENAVLFLGVELERLLLPEEPFRESIFIVFKVTIKKPAVVSYESGVGLTDKLIIENLDDRWKRKLRRISHFVPGSGLVLFFKDLRFLAVAPSTRCVQVKLSRNSAGIECVFNGFRKVTIRDRNGRKRVGQNRSILTF